MPRARHLGKMLGKVFQRMPRARCSRGNHEAARFCGYPLHTRRSRRPNPRPFQSEIRPYCACDLALAADRFAYLGLFRAAKPGKRVVDAAASSEASSYDICRAWQPAGAVAGQSGVRRSGDGAHTRRRRASQKRWARLVISISTSSPGSAPGTNATQPSSSRPTPCIPEPTPVIFTRSI